jgi:hypothetical protein
MATRVPAPVDTGATPVVTGPVDRAPAPVPPGPGSTGQIPTVKKPAGPPEAAAPAVTPNAGITVPPVSIPQGPPETVPPAVTPGPATGQSTSANVTPTVPVQELPVDTPNVDAGNNVIPNINYIQVLANGTVVVSKTTALNFAGSGVTVTGSNGAATITISGSSYGNSNVVTLLSAFGSNTVSTTGNISGGYLFGNGSQLTGLPDTYGNANVVANLAALGSNPVSTTGNVTGGNLLTGAQVVASGVIQTGTGFSTGGYLSVDGDTDLHKTTVTGNLSATGNVTGGNVLTAGLISATSTITSAANITGGNVLTAGLISASGNVTGGYLFGNGSQLTGLPAIYGNANVVANLAALGSNPVSTTGNITGGYILGNGSQLTAVNAVTVDVTDTNGLTTIYYPTFVENRTTAQIARADVNLTYRTDDNLLTVGNVSVTGNIDGGNLITSAAISTASVSASGNITASNFVGNGVGLTNVTVSVAGNIVGTSSNVSLVAGSYTTTFDNTGNVTLPGNTFSVNYANNTPVNVVTKVESSWTVPVGNSTQSFTVPINNTYQLWVLGNIPNGIIVYNATVSVSNTNVPVIGQQFAWNYTGGGNILMFTSIPAQIIGTAGAISNAQPAVANTNVFTFGINNTSGNTVTVNYGWIAIS